jgi:hypothetical protein
MFEEGFVCMEYRVRSFPGAYLIRIMDVGIIIIIRIPDEDARAFPVLLRHEFVGEGWGFLRNRPGG